MRPALLVPALLLAAAPLGAQQPALPKTAPGAPIVSRVVAGIYHADPNHTQILFEVNHLGFTEFDGIFPDAGGTLTLDPKNPAAAKVKIEIPIARVTTTNAELDKHLKAPDFFDAAKYPTASFVSTRVTVKGMAATIAGNLTVKGVTKPVVLDARFIGAGTSPMSGGTSIGFRATTKIKRSDFGVSYGVPLVSDEVKLTINAAFDLPK